jgi:RNA polymerase sigma-70 factor (ECF subfamily)
MRIVPPSIQDSDVGTSVATSDVGQSNRLPAPDLAAIYQQELDYVWHNLRRLGIPGRDLADVTQDVFVAVGRSLSDYDPARPLRPWLFGVTYRVASTHRRLFRNAREVPSPDLDPAVVAPSPEDALVQSQERDLVVDCLGQLDIKHRAVLIMYDFAEHDVAQIAEALAIPVKTVYSRLRTARLRFSAIARDIAEQRARIANAAQARHTNNIGWKR